MLHAACYTNKYLINLCCLVNVLIFLGTRIIVKRNLPTTLFWKNGEFDIGKRIEFICVFNKTEQFRTFLKFLLAFYYYFYLFIFSFFVYILLSISTKLV